MVTAPGRPLNTVSSGDRRLTQITGLAVASMILIVIGGIYLAGHLPNTPPLWPAVVVLVAGTCLVIANVFIMSRLDGFAWDSFYVVGRWALIAYVVISGMLEYIFVVDHVRGGLLLVLTGMLLVWAVDIPLLLAVSVARYQIPGRTAV